MYPVRADRFSISSTANAGYESLCDRVGRNSPWGGKQMRLCRWKTRSTPRSCGRSRHRLKRIGRRYTRRSRQPARTRLVAVALARAALAGERLPVCLHRASRTVRRRFGIGPDPSPSSSRLRTVLRAWRRCSSRDRCPSVSIANVQEAADRSWFIPDDLEMSRFHQGIALNRRTCHNTSTQFANIYRVVAHCAGSTWESYVWRMKCTPRR